MCTRSYCSSLLPQASSTIDSLMVKIRALNDQIRSLTPLTDHAAHIFSLLQFVGPRFQFHLSEFLALFKEDIALYSAKLRECLADHHENDDTATQDGVARKCVAGDDKAEEGVAEQEDNVTEVQKDNVIKSISTQKAIDDKLEEVLKTLNHTILEKASRYVDMFIIVCLYLCVHIYLCICVSKCLCLCKYKHACVIVHILTCVSGRVCIIMYVLTYVLYLACVAA